MIKKVNTPKSTYRQTIKNKVFRKVFVPNGSIIECTVLSCSWNKDLIAKKVRVIQIDYDFFMAIDYQDPQKIGWRFGFLGSSLQIH